MIIASYLNRMELFNMIFLNHFLLKNMKRPLLDEYFKFLKKKIKELSKSKQSMLYLVSTKNSDENGLELDEVRNKEDFKFILFLLCKWLNKIKVEDNKELPKYYKTDLILQNFNTGRMIYLVSWLNVNLSFRNINLSNNNLNTESIEILSNITKNKEWESLILNNNPFGSKGILYLSKLFPYLECLTTLGLDNTKMEYQGSIILASEIKLLTKLEKLYLNNNSICESGSTLLTALSELRFLSHVEMNNCQLYNIHNGIEELFRRTLKLKELHLGYNDLSKNVLEAMKNFLPLSKLEYLNIGEWKLSNEEVQVILKSLNSNKFLQFIIVKTNYWTSSSILAV
jgi:hypothetical protein